MEIIRYLILVQALIAFFVAGGISVRSRSLKSSALSLLVAMFGFHIFVFIYGTSDLLFLYPEFSGWFYFEISFLFGPLLIIYLRAVSTLKTKLNWWDGLHLLPVILYWIFYNDVLFMEPIARMQYIDANFDRRVMPWNYLLAAQMLIYGLWAIAMLIRKRNRFKGFDFIYCSVLVGIYFAATLVISYLTQYASSWRDFAYYYLINNCLILMIGVILYRDPQFLKQIRRKYMQSSLDQLQMEQIQAKLEKLLVSKHIYKSKALTLDSLAEQLGVPGHHLSQTFSEHICENFNDYINRRRVLMAQDLLCAPAYKHYKIEAIAMEAGFNNKVTFYKAFAKFSGQTPAAFRKSKNQ